MDQPHSAPAIYYNNTLALMKLKESKRLCNVPKGVFRCILEYQLPKVLRWRYSNPYAPIQKQQDTHFPAIEKLDYDNYLVAMNEIPNDIQY